MGRARSSSVDAKVRKRARETNLTHSLTLLPQVALVVLGLFVLNYNLKVCLELIARQHVAQKDLTSAQHLVNEIKQQKGEWRAATEKLEKQLRTQVKQEEQRLRNRLEAKVMPSNGGTLDLSSAEVHFKKAQEGMRPPPDLNLVVILGVKFILERDFPIWDLTFNEANHMVVKTTKKKLARGENSDWKVLKCLDLFDGKSHCIEPKDLTGLKRYQRVSRLYGLRKTLWNKDRFCETMNEALGGYNEDGGMNAEFVFPCWMLPMDFKDLITSAKGKNKDRQFILKPTDRGEGAGIVVVDDWHQLVNWKSKFPDNDEVVVQTYLPNPFLINQRKWDMRTYVLVTSVNPLRAYMFRDGLVRFASSKYEKDAKGGGKATSFLTNTSVNKKNGIAVDELTWPFPKVYRWLKANDFDPDMLWSRIESAVTRMLLSAEPSFSHIFETLQPGFTCANCYQLLGVDVIVDDTVTPRVIEVNGEPSMQLTGEVGSHYDYTKRSMTRSLVALLYTQADVAKELSLSLMEVELAGISVGFEADGCLDSHDYCLTPSEVEYLVEMRREEQNIGGFRRIYPTRRGEEYSKFVKHLGTKFPPNSKTGSYRLHPLITKLAQQSKIETDNEIDDPTYVDHA
mmetsp:Transcript_4711/g.8348  ORF Transcript_4711/g.8348 Transcript_4711/m.8348 type:complete len:624 (+) Transcript_4711:268-2139(+)|eukprot:CAMPEP_0184513540 /NCGR_PEP_ID=MMETSP0198_2-20121128/3478_1 /TAXON_ID=1112570 /ORGANISM="Thraustochytrium sp., Strain LLF1b" /LENGTH=623 /DNA_ID=CAMNT_0026903657 /DNA_START=215 /DNA_END=2086 /DNA_ORIENTATION=+